MKLYLPFPPSVNGLFAGKTRRYKSKVYEDWIYEATLMLNHQPMRVFSDPVSISYQFGRPDNRRRDLDNLFKAPNDLLVSRGILLDDDLIHRISGEWADISGAQIEIRII